MTDLDRNNYLNKLYKNRFKNDKTIKKDKSNVWKILCKYYFQKYIHKNDKILDIAAGYCEFSNNICVSRGGG